MDNPYEFKSVWKGITHQTSVEVDMDGDINFYQWEDDSRSEEMDLVILSPAQLQAIIKALTEDGYL